MLSRKQRKVASEEPAAQAQAPAAAAAAEGDGDKDAAALAQGVAKPPVVLVKPSSPLSFACSRDVRSAEESSSGSFRSELLAMIKEKTAAQQRLAEAASKRADEAMELHREELAIKRLKAEIRVRELALKEKEQK